MEYPQFNLTKLVAGTADKIPVPENEFWVFAYGSLMWNPGFDFLDARPAVLYGYHRRLCLWSVRYRGTEAKPGLVLGLDRGGSCRGYAYHISQQQTHSVVDYLCERELITGAYDARLCSVVLEEGRKVSALTFVSKQDHPHFVPKLALNETISVVRDAKGARGCNRSYVLNTVTHMNQMNIRDTELHRIANHLESND
jgi:cation transport protein ChaC